MTMRAFEAIARFLAEERAGKPVFGLMGDANLAYIAAYREQHNGLYSSPVLEGAAVSMADGYSRMSGHVGVASVTHGPAVTNTLTALTEAARGRSPIVMLTGDLPAHINDHFQYVDIQGVARVAGAHFERVNSITTLLGTLNKAFTRAASARLPVVVDIPHSLLTAEVEWVDMIPGPFEPQGFAPDEDTIDRILGPLLSARRPLIIAGRGVIESGGRNEVLELARTVNAPVMTSLLGKDLFTGEPENLGIHGGLSTPSGIAYMAEADVVLSFGASLNNWTTDYYALLKDKTVIQTDVDAARFARYGPIADMVLADAKQLASALVDRINDADMRPGREAYMEQIAADPNRERRDTFRSTTRNGAVDMKEAALRLSAAMPPGTINVSDIGRHNHSTWPHIQVTPGRWTLAGSFGSIGLGTATGLGASYHDRTVPTVVWAGDGGAMQGLIEMSTAVRHDIPLILVVMNDQCYGAEYVKLQTAGVSEKNAFFEWAPLSEVAESLGARSIRVTDSAGLDRAVDLVAEGNYPLVIEVMADPADVVEEASVGPLPASS